jgi:hypothetical protein
VRTKPAHSWTRRIKALFGTLAATALFLSTQIPMAQPAQAAVGIPQKINFQGRLTNSSGNVLSDGLYNVKFRLWTAASAGSNVWQEDRVRGAADNRIQVTNGLFNIQFGDITALSGVTFDANALYLEVELPTPATATCATNGCAVFTEGAMTPRQPLAAAAYAFNADKLDGIDGASFARNDTSNTFAASQVVDTNSTAAFVIQNTASNKLFVANTTNQVIGIGVTPSAAGARLQVAGGGAVPALAVTTSSAATADIMNVTTSQAITTAGVNAFSINYTGGAAAVEAAAMRIDLTPGTTSGGTWSALRVVAGATGAVAGVNEYGLKLQGPTSLGAGTETALYIDSNWDTAILTNNGAINAGTGTITSGAINSGAVSSSSTVTGTQLVSTIATGTAPLQVASTTMVNNLNSQYLNGTSENQLAQNLRAGYNVTGGGTLSFISSNLTWSQRLIVISNGKGSDASSGGYFDITMPANGTVLTGANTTNVTVTASGIPLAAWQALYYILPNGSTNTTVNANFRVVSYNGTDYQAPSNWLLLALYNGDNTTLRVANGVVLRSGQSTTAGSVDNAIFNTSVTTPILQSAAATTLLIDSGTTGAINIGTGANQKTVTIGNSTGTTDVVINSGTNGIDIGTNAVNKSIDIGSTGSTANTTAVNIATSTGAAQTVSVGSTNSGSSVKLTGGTNALSVTNTGIGINDTVPEAALDVNGLSVSNAENRTGIWANGGAEAGLSHTTLSGSVEALIETTTVKAGTKSFRLRNTAQGFNYLYSDYFPAAPGQAMTLSYWRQTSSIAASGVLDYALLWCADNSGTFVATAPTYSGTLPSAANTWEFVNEYTKIPSTSTIQKCRVALIVSNNSVTPDTTNFSYFDDVTVNQASQVSNNVLNLDNTNGNLTVNGTVTANTTTLSGSALTFGAASTATIQSAASQALNLTGKATSTFSTTAGDITLSAGSGNINLQGATIVGNATTQNLFNTVATTINFGGAAGTLNIGPTGATATSINLAGGSGATGCTLDGSNGNYTCSGLITGNTIRAGSTANQQISMSAGAGSHGIEIGRTDSVASTPFIDFHSGTTGGNDYDSRIIASGGTGSIGGGTLTLQAATSAISGNATVGGTLSVTGTTTLTGALSVNSGINAKGYVTSNTSSTFNGQYTLLGRCTITAQFQDCRSVVTVISAGDGGTTGQNATVDFRVKQQNALAGVPYVNVVVTNSTTSMAATHFTAVTVTNDATSTVVELYGQINPTFMTWDFNPLINNGSVQVAWLAGQGFISSLPAGATTVGINADVTATNITQSGTLAINGGTVTSTATTVNFLQSTVTTLNIGGAVGSGGINLGGGSSSTGCTVDGSNGNLACSGGFTGTSLQSTAGAALLVDSGTTGALNIGTGANAKTITLGNNTGGTAVNINAGSTVSIVAGNSSLTTNASGTIAKTTSNSTTAFQVQNTSNVSLLTVDTAGNNIVIGGNNSGALQNWITSTATGLGARRDHTSVTYNGYAYVIGGTDAAGAVQNTVYYAKLNADGSPGNWATTVSTGLTARDGHISVVANGYVYVIGGSNGGALNTIFAAKINSDGTLGSWSASNNTGLGARNGASAVVANGYVYVIGGVDGSGTIQSTVYLARLNTDGTLGNWTTSSATGLAARVSHTSVVANGYVYVIGGNDSSLVTQNTVYYAKLNADGTLGNWSTTVNTGLGARDGHASVVANGYVYVIGGPNGAAPQNTVYYSKINTDGTLGSWSSNSSTGLAARSSLTAVVANGYVYAIGGANGSSVAQSSVYYASTQRVTLGGSLDLVGLGNGTLADASSTVGVGSVGGSLTAGDTRIVGNFDVAGQANFMQNVNVDQALNVGSFFNADGSKQYLQVIANNVNNLDNTAGILSQLNEVIIDQNTTATTDVSTDGGYKAFKFNTGNSTHIGGLKLRLKKDAISSPSPNSLIHVELYSSVGSPGTPSAKVVASTSIHAATLSTAYATKTFAFFQNVSANTSYWVVVYGTGGTNSYFNQGTSGSNLYATSTDASAWTLASGTPWYQITGDSVNAITGVSVMGQGLWGTSVAGTGVTGVTTLGIGVRGTSVEGDALSGSSAYGAGVSASSNYGSAAVFSTNAASTSDTVTISGNSSMTGALLSVSNGNAVLKVDRSANLSIGSSSDPKRFYGIGPKLDIQSSLLVPSGVTQADLDGDGHEEIINVNNGSNTAIITNFVGGSTATLNTGTGPIAVATGDFNGDSNLDVIITNAGTTTASVYINPGGGFSTVTPTSASYTLTTGSQPQSVATGDFNSDGKIDAVVGNYAAGAASNLYVYYNTGTSLPTTVTPTIGTLTGVTGPDGIASGDFNGDGRTDIVATNYGVTGAGTTATVYQQVANGPNYNLQTTASSTLTGLSGPVGITAADFDNEGTTDVAIANYSAANGSTVSMFYNLGSALPTSSASALQTGASSGPLMLDSGNFNDDNSPDLVVTNYNGGVAGNNAVVYINSGNVSGLPTTATASLTTGTGPYGVATGDIFGVGYSSIVTANSTSGTISLFLPYTSAKLDVRNNNTYGLGQILQAASGQVADIMQIQDSAGSALLSVDARGDVTMTGGELLMANPNSNTIRFNSDPSLNVSAPGAGSNTGTRMILYGSGSTWISGTYALGIESGTMWFTSNSAYKFYTESTAGAGTLLFSIIKRGAANTIFSIDAAGNIKTDGSTTIGTPADVAENYSSPQQLNSGDVVTFAGGTDVVKSTEPFQSTLAGVISDNPGLVLSGNTEGYPLALSGRVPVNVTDEGGPIKPGDYLTSSSTPGKAMKANAAGPTIGRALTGMDSGSGRVEAYVANTYYDPTHGNNMQGSQSVGDINVTGKATVNNLAVTGTATFASDVTVNGHIVTGGGKPTVEAQAAAGQNATVEVEGNDISGTITMTAGDRPAKGDLLKLIFNKAYGAPPRVVISPSNEDAVDMRLFKSATTNDNVIFRTKDLPVADKIYKYDYFIAQ